MQRGSITRVGFDESTNAAVRDTFPGFLTRTFEVLTHFGDGAVLLAAAAIFYWFSRDERRRERAIVLGIAVGGLGFVAALQGVFGVSRPDPASLEVVGSTDAGYGFPSTHAFVAAAVFGALSQRSRLGTARGRYAVVVTIVTIVSLSRITSGAHYVTDVVVGVGLGLAFLFFVLRDPDPQPGTLFVLAGLAAIVAALLGAREFITLAVGASVGTTVAWAYETSRPPASPRGGGLVLAGSVALAALVIVRAGTTLISTPWLVEVVGYAVVTAGLVLVPQVAVHIDHWEAVETLQERLPFDGRTIDPNRRVVTTEE